MCLDKITSEPDPNYKGIAYKVFKMNMCSAVLDAGPYVIGITYQARHLPVHASSGEVYNSGFHCFFEFDDAINFAYPTNLVAEVEVTNLIARGPDCVRDTGVFDRMTIKRVVGRVLEKNDVSR